MSIAVTIRLHLEIPRDRALSWLDGTKCQGVSLDRLSSADRLRIADIFEQRIGEDFAEMLDHVVNEPEVEVDW